MSWIGNVLKGAGENLVGGLVSGGIGQLTSSLFGGKKQSFETTRKQQYLLNQDAASINHYYNEIAAESAYKRQMEAYKQTYEDQSYQAMRKQMEDAGLSVGLMYGGSGSGGGAGQLGGGTQASSGGAMAGNAVQAYGMALQSKQLELQERQVNADATLKQAQAQNIEKQTEQTAQNIDINEFTRMLNKERERAAKSYVDWEIDEKWIEMNQKKLNAYFDQYVKLGRNPGWDKTLGDFDFEGNLASRELEAKIQEMVQNAAESSKRTDLMEFDKTLKQAQAYNQFMIITVLLARNKIEEAKVAIQRYVAKYATGEEWNWKTVMDAGLGVIKALGPIIAAAA
ncbi:DNA pilot protein [Dipodfec virus UOA04_Rod_663]|nr:DNA pilot protein [Dipodfec virus UOA04_Rod_663]